LVVISRKKKSGRGDLANALRFFSQLALTIIACVAIGVFLGIWLDGLLNTSPWLLLVFSFLGMGAAFKSIIELGKR
jgi:ATP synthase protein I